MYHETAALLTLQTGQIGFGSSPELPVISGRSPDTPTYVKGAVQLPGKRSLVSGWLREQVEEGRHPCGYWATFSFPLNENGETTHLALMVNPAFMEGKISFTP